MVCNAVCAGVGAVGEIWHGCFTISCFLSLSLATHDCWLLPSTMCLSVWTAAWERKRPSPECVCVYVCVCFSVCLYLYDLARESISAGDFAFYFSLMCTFVCQWATFKWHFCGLKGTVQPKITILLSFTHSHVVLNYTFFQRDHF